MFSNKPLKKILIALILCVILVFVCYYFLFLDIKSKNENISVLLNNLGSQHDEEQYAISTEKIIKNISPDIDSINNSIISLSGDIKFIEDLELMARSNGLVLEIESLVFEDNPRFIAVGATLFKIRAKTRGSWAGTYRLLDQLESSPFKIKIVQFAFLGQSIPVGTGKSKIEWQSLFEIHVLKYK